VLTSDLLFYRIKKGPKTRVTLDFIDQFYREVAQELKSPLTQDFINRTRIPNERELYGLLIKALLKVGGDEDIGHVATEVQVDRIVEPDDADSTSTGRVDILVNYRKTVFLIEVKVARVSLSSTNLTRNEDSKAIRAWNSAVDQLQAIRSDRVQALLEQDIRKLALVVCLYYDGRTTEREDGWENLISEHHQQICDQIDDNSIQATEYDWKSAFDEPIFPYRRKSKAVDEQTWLTLYGFSLLGATVD